MRTGVIGPAGFVLVMAVVLSSCQQTQVIGVVNHCDRRVAVDAVSSAQAADDDPQWTALAPGERADVRSVSADAESVYLMARTPDTERSRNAEISLDGLSEPPEEAGLEADVEIVLSGERCPKSR